MWTREGHVLVIYGAMRLQWPFLSSLGRGREEAVHTCSPLPLDSVGLCLPCLCLFCLSVLSVTLSFPCPSSYFTSLSTGWLFLGWSSIVSMYPLLPRLTLAVYVWWITHPFVSTYPFLSSSPFHCYRRTCCPEICCLFLAVVLSP